MSDVTLHRQTTPVLEVRGAPLSVEQVSSVALGYLPISLTRDPAVIARVDAARQVVQNAVDDQKKIYGVTTGFGGMAGVPVPAEQAATSQSNLLSFLASGAGRNLDRRHVRAAMLLRANMLLQGASGVRLEIVDRLVRFLSANATPVVRELGSIGASGDLVPLATIARAITGQAGGALIDLGDNEVVNATTMLAQLNLEPISLLPKEALAIVNGTSFSSGMAASCVHEARNLLGTAIVTHAMMLRALCGHEEPFDAFVHDCKPHAGQVWTAAIMRRLLRQGVPATNGQVVNRNLQDRYSLRCIPQYFGPIVEGVARVSHVVQTEMNAVTDNPLIDAERGKFYQSGNFLGQYIGIAMDDLRRFVGLLAKHLDIQIAQLVSPEFNHGLPASLKGNSQLPYNMGLKGLQITGNSIMPLLTYYGNPLVEHFPTHAEQYNQNVNGLSWGAANLAWESIRLFQNYSAVAAVFAVQALDLRAKEQLGHHDGRALIGELVEPFYAAVYETCAATPGDRTPLVFNDADQSLERFLDRLTADLHDHGTLLAAVGPVLEWFDQANLAC